MSGPRRYRYGYVVSGVGTDPVNFPGGVCWFYGQKFSPSIHASLDQDWIGGFGTGEGLADFPQSVSSNVQPFDASVSASSHTFKLHYSTGIALEFFNAPTSSEIFVDKKIQASHTSIEIVGEGANLLSNTVVWIDDEAILLGTFSVDEYTGCTRGMYRTFASVHEIGAYVWKKNPRRIGRLVTQLRLDLDTSEVVQRWQGLLSDNPETSPNGTHLILRANEIFTAISGGVLNRGAKPIAAGWVNIRSDGIVLGSTEFYNRRVGKPGGNTRQYYQVNDALVKGFSKTREVFDLAVPLAGSFFEETGTPEKIFELLAIDRLHDLENTAVQASATVELDYPYHPVAIAMALLCSNEYGVYDGANYNVFGAAFGGGIPIDWFDRDKIDALILETSHVVIDLLILGWDGEEFNPWETSKEIFKIYGFFWGRSEEGKVIVGRYKEATRKDFLEAQRVTVYPTLLKLRSAYSETIDTISGTIGETPWSEGVPFSVQSSSAFQETNSVRSGFLSQSRESNLDVKTKLDPFEVIEALTAIGDARHQAIPRLKLRVNLGDYYHGQFVVIRNPAILVDWFVDNGGVVTDIENSASFIGMIVGINELTKEPAAEIEVMLTNHRLGEFARVRAPSGVVVSFDTVNIEIEENAFTATGDGLEFALGDKVELHDSTGARRIAVGTGERTVVAVTGDFVTIDAAFSVNPVSGDVLRIAVLGSTGTPSENVAYVFLGADDGTVGTDGVAAHKYGLGIL